MIVEKEAIRCRVIDPGSEGEARASTGRGRMSNIEGTGFPFEMPRRGFTEIPVSRTAGSPKILYSLFMLLQAARSVPGYSRAQKTCQPPNNFLDGTQTRGHGRCAIYTRDIDVSSNHYSDYI